MNKAIIRACLKPFSLSDKAVSGDLEFEQAIYLASPSLHLKLKNTDNSNCHPIKKYWKRSSTRPTPFGLFAGCGTAEATTQPLSIDSKNFCARLDYKVLHHVVAYLLKDPLLKTLSRYFPNNTIYKVHDEYRYLEYLSLPGKRDYRMSAVKASDAITAVLEASQQGCSYSDLLERLISTEGCDITEAESFLQELIESQILISELVPGISQECHLENTIYLINSWIQQLDRTKTKLPDIRKKEKQRLESYLKWLSQIQTCIDTLNRKHPSFSKAGQSLETHLKTRLSDLESQPLFHVDTLLTLKPISHDKWTQSSAPLLLTDKLIKKIFPALLKLSEPTVSPNLEAFKDQFVKRYYNREVPLLEALDPDIGVGYYPHTDSSHHPFLKNLEFSNSEVEEQIFAVTKAESLKQKLLQNAISLAKKEIKLDDEILQTLEAKGDNLPPSMSVMLRKVAGSQFFLESFGGVSAINLISRFAYADPGINSLAEEISKKEAFNNPDFIFARIIHLSEEKAGNVVQHKTFRQYEIPILSLPSVEPEYQIPLQDLYLSIQQDKLVLRSSRLNRRIIPRLDTAHNYHLSELPVYRFLCDLQYQDTCSNLGFDWGYIEKHYKFLPRVSYKNVILNAAYWKFDCEDVKSIKAAKNKIGRFEAFRKFCQLWQLPKYWVYAEGDRELLISTDDPEQVELWWDEVKKKETFTLKEYFLPDSSIVNQQDEPYSHQVIIPWINPKRTYQGMFNAIVSAPLLTRSFVPGSEWSYFKVYGKAGTADLLLESVIGSLVKELKVEKIIDQWFFIRYADPDEHLRLRFHLTSPEHCGFILQKFQSTLESFKQKGIVHKWQVDTYEREIGRYQGVSIKESEALFFADSEAVIKLISTLQGDEREGMRWQWAVLSIDYLLEDFSFTLEEKSGLMAELALAFAKEFSVDKIFRLSLDKKYRNHKDIIRALLCGNVSNLTCNAWQGVFKKRSKDNKPLAKILLQRHNETGVQDLLKSYIHMSLNRIFPSAQRQQEFVLYYFLNKHYHSQIKIRQYKQVEEKNDKYSLV